MKAYVSLLITFPTRVSPFYPLQQRSFAPHPIDSSYHLDGTDEREKDYYSENSYAAEEHKREARRKASFYFDGYDF